MFNKLIQTYFKPKRVLFYRDLQTYTGGHQKVADYFSHLSSSHLFNPSISFSDATLWDTSNPWLACDRSEYMPMDYDYAFLAGMDWQKYLSVSRPHNQPVINLIQGVRHSQPESDTYKFLSHKAIRICVSSPVAEAIALTGRVNGPIFTISNGVKLPSLPQINKDIDVLILGTKSREAAEWLRQRLSLEANVLITLQNDQIAQSDLYNIMNRSKILVALPFEQEGFYLPALEAMNYCDLVVVPDCVGNRDFCIDGKNCLMPRYDREAILASTLQAISLLEDKQVLTEFKREMSDTVSRHSLAAERKAFLKLMNNVGKLWAESF